MGLIRRTFDGLMRQFIFPVYMGHVGMYLAAVTTQDKYLACGGALVGWIIGMWLGPKIWNEQME